MISIKHLSKTYTDRLPHFSVLLDINCEISKGEVISIIGPSGTGKSTFLRCINGLEKATSGEIVINGVNILDKNADLAMVRRKMGMVFQSFNLFNHLSILENLTVGPCKLLGMSKADAEKQAMDLLRMVGLADKAHNMPAELSGGQKQRVAIARCLSMKPEIILFDEPTSALDPAMVGEVLSVIRQLAQQGMTMLIVTHEMKFARDVSSRIFFMYDGVIYEDDTPEVIFTRPNKPATTAFINKICGIDFQIENRNFDLIGLCSQVDQFCMKYAINQSICEKVKQVLQEMITHVLPLDKPLTLNVDYSEKKDRVYLSFYQKGCNDAILAKTEVAEAFHRLVEPFCATVHDDPDGDNRLLRLKIRNLNNE